jgi:hypothetical protein
MGGACRLNNAREVVSLAKSDLIRFLQPIPDPHRKRSTDATHFDGMDQSMVHVIVLIKGLDLSLVGQPTERSRKYDAVVILDKNRPIRSWLIIYVTKTLATKQPLPFHLAVPMIPLLADTSPHRDGQAGILRVSNADNEYAL